MLINGKHYRSIEITAEEVKDKETTGKLKIKVIDQRYLPFRVEYNILSSADDVIEAISSMQIRGAPLIGLVAAFGVVFACCEAKDFGYIGEKAQEIIDARPTAINARNCVETVLNDIKRYDTLPAKRKTALKSAVRLLEEDIITCRQIGEHGLELIRKISKRKKGKAVNILTHCNAGWLACSDYGTATAAMYLAKEEGINLHIWVDETRPRNQGARLTVWELTHNGIDNTLITDNAGGYLMRQGLVDMVLVGSDRTTLSGDVVNKIGTYLKALAAKDNKVPFYAALPSTSFAWNDDNALIDKDKKIIKPGENKKDNIPIENRSSEEVRLVEGLGDTVIKSVLITCEEASCLNPGFDVTPARLVTGLITERGICEANRKSINKLFPEKKMSSSL